MNRRRFCAALFASAFGASRLRAEPAAEPAAAANAYRFDFMSLMSKTGGGKQFWADVWFFHDWRIQCHALTNHYRLLDGANHRLASGTFDDCRAKLDEDPRARQAAADGRQGPHLAAWPVSHTDGHDVALQSGRTIRRLHHLLHGLSHDARQR